ncbi:NADAP protein, partial [Polypterus senegalus]
MSVKALHGILLGTEGQWKYSSMLQHLKPGDTRTPTYLSAVLPNHWITMAIVYKGDGSEVGHRADSEPSWGGIPDSSYSIEVLKNGAIVHTVPLGERNYTVIGRLPSCDVALEHPSVSRYHAVLQGRRAADEGGLFIYDLGSTHGTFVNKKQVPPKTYVRLKVGHVLKFGGSTRLFILQGPESDAEAECEQSVTELKEMQQRRQEELERKMMGDGSDEELEPDEIPKSWARKQHRGCRMYLGNRFAKMAALKDQTGSDVWGTGSGILLDPQNTPPLHSGPEVMLLLLSQTADEVQEEDDENEENPFATGFQEDTEAFYIKDPKKALQGFFDREGEELEYEFDDKGRATWICRARLPADDASGRQLVAEVTHTGKKKEAAIQCALEACRMLDARGLLRQEAVSRKRRKKNWEDEDFYDSDDDTFLDRTGAIEKKRQDRMRKAGKIQEKPDTFDSLVVKLQEVEKELAETEQKLNLGKGDCQPSADDPLDAFMKEVRTGGTLDSITRKKLHLRASELKKEGQHLRKLVEIARPAQMPELETPSTSEAKSQEKPKKLSLPMFGAMKGGSKFKLKTGTIGVTSEDPLADNEADVREAEPGRSREDEDVPERLALAAASNVSVRPKEVETEKAAGSSVKRKKPYGPSRPPAAVLSAQYPSDDPDYCVWMPPKGEILPFITSVQPCDDKAIGTYSRGSEEDSKISQAPRLPKAGETVHGHKFFIGFGGKGANQCVQASRLGAKTAMVCKLGQDVFGNNYLQNFKDQGVTTDFVSQTGEAATGAASIIVNDQGENAIVIVAGANLLLDMEDLKKASLAISTARVLVCQLEISPAVSLQALKMARNSGAFGAPGYMCHVRYADPRAHMYTQDGGFSVDVSSFHIASESENDLWSAELLTGLEVTDEDLAGKAAVVLLSRGCRSVIVTLGVKGCLMVSAQDATPKHIPVGAVPAVDTTREQPGGLRRCYNCRRPGHERRYCPRGDRKYTVPPRFARGQGQRIQGRMTRPPGGGRPSGRTPAPEVATKGELWKTAGFRGRVRTPGRQEELSDSGIMPRGPAGPYGLCGVYTQPCWIPWRHQESLWGTYGLCCAL